MVDAGDVKACHARVVWWSGEYEGECARPDGHGGPHYDGLSWFDDGGEEVEAPDDAESLADMARHLPPFRYELPTPLMLHRQWPWFYGAMIPAPPLRPRIIITGV